MSSYQFTDIDGDVLQVRGDGDGRAIIAVGGGRSPEAVYVPAHKLAEVTRALYRAAGQPVPDLPDILDAKLVGELTADIHYAMYGTSTGPNDDAVTTAMARVLLAHGWTKP